MIKKIILIVSIFIITQNLFSQHIGANRILDLKRNTINIKSNDTIIKNEQIHSNKSPGVSFLLSLILPGAGHFYAGRMDVGQYFVASEIAMWLGFSGLTIYGNRLIDDAKSYSVLHSNLSTKGKDDDYFANVATFNSIYEYNNSKLIKGEYDKVYFDINKYYWNWDNERNRFTFDDNRKKSEQMYNARIIFVSGLIVNRIASSISSLILTKKMNETANISTGFTYDGDNNIDGMKLNFKLNF